MAGAKVSQAGLEALDEPLTRCYLDALAARLPVLGEVLRSHGETPLGDYVRSLSRRPRPSLQGRDDLARIVAACSAPLLGERAAAAAAESLIASPTILTANHHGVDYFAQSVQGTLALALRDLESTRGRGAAVVVLACAAVPLNNLTYPRGLLAYVDPALAGSPQPVKLPLFPDRFKRTLVCNAPALDGDMVERARTRLARMRGSGAIPEPLASTIDTVLAQDYLSASVLVRSRYSEQATILNQRIWKRMLAPVADAPELVYLDLEQVCSQLLLEDLMDASSLVSTVLFHAGVRESVLALLDGERACWTRAELTRRALGASGARPGAGAGTVFFWGLDRCGRRIPLGLHAAPDCGPELAGAGDGGETVRIPLRPESLARGLKEFRLLPSLFLSYLCLAMARGVNCLGGYYQAGYLPVMQEAVAAALGSVAGCEREAQALREVRPDGYLSGMQGVCTRSANGGLLPAGPLEIIAGGGLDADDMRKLAILSVRAAHEASIVDTVCDAGRDLVSGKDWRARLSLELDSLHGSALVVKGVERAPSGLG